MDFLIVDDDRIFSEASSLLIEEEGHYVEAVDNAEEALQCLRLGKFDAVLLDVHLGRQSGLDLLGPILKVRPNQAVVMFSARSTIKNAVQAIQLGAVDFLEKPFTREHFLAVVARVRRFGELGRQIESLEERVKEGEAQQPEPVIDFKTPAMRSVMEVLRRAAKSSASVLILGESGTGKTMAARAVHQQSHIADKPFVTVSCPSLTKELLESQLFGHVRGAFTGAMRDHWGKVHAANGGTLFLDEIGDLPLEVQPKLLRLLQEREYERVGETISRRADVRIVAATNRDLKQRVAEGSFREDLYYRLNVITVQVPPLRDHPLDVPRLAEHYMKHFAKRYGRPAKDFAPSVEETLRLYSWPGNLRELNNVIERAVILSNSTVIEPADLPLEIRQPAGADASAAQIGAMISLDRMKDLHIRRVTEKCSSLVEASEVLGIDQATLYRWRKKMDAAEVAGQGQPPLAPVQ